MGGTGSSAKTRADTCSEKRTGAKFSYCRTNPAARAQTQMVGNHTESNVTIAVRISKSGGRPGPGALRVRHGADLLQDQGDRDAVVETISDLQGRRAPGRTIFDAARDVPARKVTPNSQGSMSNLLQKVTQTAEVQGYMEKQR